MNIKNENCQYCNTKMESVRTRKRFCSDKCRVYYSRDKKPVDEVYIPDVKEVPKPTKKTNDEIEQKIREILLEKIPTERNNTLLGRKVWATDQKNRIDKLRNGL